MKIKILSILLVIIAVISYSQTITKPFAFGEKSMEITITPGEKWINPTEKTDGTSYVVWAEGTSGSYSNLLVMSEKITLKPELQPEAFPFWSYKKTKIAVDVNSGATYQTAQPLPQEVAYYIYIEVSQPLKEGEKEKSPSIIYMATYSLNEGINELEMVLLGYGSNGYVNTNISGVEEIGKIVKGAKILVK
ncbi:MAG: hypothetical protein A2W91_12345 [Bacteroidetes bacterium GWF2_38_335]|nr:MAG: hypothetical protein A2W91_12345 [Bacteroidetes bacterium GWF2_38_335]OFY76959.1 MAG: hypothetical protein A2281_00460 [Bacteroidetes bacterium RIFOXYA12_FULL_38_20]HBS86813.1 hypothetical protein [Bacteroidales bacterium]